MDPRQYAFDTMSVLTPALAIYPDVVDANIRATIDVLGGDPNRWRPHVKTAKLAYTMKRMVAAGVTHGKCATTLELQAAAAAGMTDILVAYSLTGRNAIRLLELAASLDTTRVSILIENEYQARQWPGSRVGVFVDINGGMNRTGIEQERADEVIKLVRALPGLGVEFRGLHYYDGHMGGIAPEDRKRAAHAGYDRLMELVMSLESSGIQVPEVITSGTPAMPYAADYWPFESASFVHRVSPGTVVYNDTTSLEQLPGLGYAPAVVVVATVVSHPKPGIVTCDAGHKAVSADAGIPTCAVLGRPDLLPLKPSEEHLPIEVLGGVPPAVGETLYLVPRHVCPTVNLFDEALLIRNGKIEGVERVTARGHEFAVAMATR
jgi:D-serine deaminase-like pyridoxal phosphate-dependent protein